jgi:hypothetical protein
VYLYANMDVGDCCKRIIFTTPIIKINEDNSVSIYLDYSSCLYSDISKVLHFKDRLTSSTFELEIHSEDVSKRAFDEKNIKRYHEISKSLVPAIVENQKTTAPAKTKKPDPKAANATQSRFPESSGVVTELDSFLIEVIDRALENSANLFSHGVVRFRLEQLLENATDKLLEFRKTRTGQDNSDAVVVIQV